MQEQLASNFPVPDWERESIVFSNLLMCSSGQSESEESSSVRLMTGVEAGVEAGVQDGVEVGVEAAVKGVDEEYDEDVRLRVPDWEAETHELTFTSSHSSSRSCRIEISWFTSSTSSIPSLLFVCGGVGALGRRKWPFVGGGIGRRKDILVRVPDCGRGGGGDLGVTMGSYDLGVARVPGMRYPSSSSYLRCGMRYPSSSSYLRCCLLLVPVPLLTEDRGYSTMSSSFSFSTTPSSLFASESCENARSDQV